MHCYLSQFIVTDSGIQFILNRKKRRVLYRAPFVIPLLIHSMPVSPFR
jgi:hypothetical protein